MPYKNDNLDELFQKAAGDYPLKTDNPDWDAVSARLTAPVKKTGTVNNKMWKYAAVILLLAGGSVILYKYQFNSESTKQQYQSTKQDNKKDQQKSSNQVTHPGLLKIDNAGTPVNNKPGFTLNSVKKQNTPGIPANTYSAMNRDIENINPATQTNQPVLQDEVTNSSSENIKQDNYTANPLEKNKDQVAGVENKQGISKNNAATDKPSKSAKQVVRFNPIFSRLYGTLYAGPEFSTVKFQQVEKPGYKIGIALGYRINRNLSAEIGLQREHLNFYSDGKYIDTSMLKIKADNTSIESVNAKSKLTSVPVTLRYNFSSRGYGHFFVAAGFNAVIITHSEQYKYAVSKDGIEGNLSKNYSALRSPKYFTGINASAGYETKLSNWCNLKIEPYYQTPINDFGVGKLPVSNFGVDIGIVKDLK